MHIVHSKHVHTFPSTDAISAALESYVAKVSAEAVARHGIFTVAISGGSLPALLAAKLRNNTSIDFSTWHLFFADERCVPLSHSDSNYALVKKELLDPLAASQGGSSRGGIPESQIYTINPDLVDNPEEAAEDYMEKLKNLFAKKNSVKVPCFDLILLGTGPDGHTASLFPDHALLKEDIDWVSYLTDSPKPPNARITLTLPVLNHAHNVAFVVTGEGKQDTIKKVLDGPEEATEGTVVADPTDALAGPNQVKLLPAALVKPVSLVWFLDNAAAAKLKSTMPTPFKL